MNRIEQYRQNLFEAQAMAVRLESEEGTTEEQIQARCSELRNHILNSEDGSNGFRNPTIAKIFNSGPRFKKL